MSEAAAPSESLIGHLVELRNRLLKAVVALALALLAMLPFAQTLYHWLSAPLLAKLPAGGQLVAIDVVSPFFTPLKLAAVAAVFVAMPAVLYQVWAFVAPGLYKHEKRLALPLLAAAVGLFYAGCAFAYFLVLPALFGFIAAFAPEGVAVMPDIARYLDFVLALSLVFGVCFEVPVAVVILALLRIVTVAQLREARGYVVVGVFVIAAIVTPPDVISQLMLAIPMCLLYEAGILVSAMLVREKASAA